MKGNKIIYYGFGAFIGFVCGVAINLIFYFVEKSGAIDPNELVRNYGVFGRYLIETVKALPIIGAGIGIILVQLLFKKELGDED